MSGRSSGNMFCEGEREGEWERREGRNEAERERGEEKKKGRKQIQSTGDRCHAPMTLVNEPVPGVLPNKRRVSLRRGLPHGRGMECKLLAFPRCLRFWFVVVSFYRLSVLCEASSSTMEM